MMKHNMNQFGRNIDGVTIVDFRIRKNHKNKSLVALWRYNNSRSSRLLESDIVREGRYAYFDTGAEHRRIYVPCTMYYKMPKIV